MIPSPLRCVVSVSGLRGIVGESLDPVTVLALAQACVQVMGNDRPLVIGRDSRPSGAMLVQAAAAGAMAAGADVIDLGIVPTPTVPLAVTRLEAAGGIQVSASHNPGHWNALKFYGPSGRNVDQAQLDAILAAYQALDLDRCQPAAGCGRMQAAPDALGWHLAAVVAAVDTEAIRARGYRVLIDCVNGAGARLGPRLLAALGCQVTAIHADPELPFPRDPEPTADHLRQTCALVAAAGVDLAFVQDPDADRLAIIDGQGRYIGEEYTFALCAAARLAAARQQGAKRPAACTNVSTSRLVDLLAAPIGAEVHRTPVGEAHVLDAMDACGAVIGGEGNGGVIDPRVVACRDSHIAMALVLECMAQRDHRLEDIVDSLPPCHMHKEKIVLDRQAVNAAMPQLRSASWAADAVCDTTDGIKFLWPDSWVHLRASGTEAASRIIAEAPTIEAARTLAARVRACLPTT